jgi:hypothetical protein
VLGRVLLAAGGKPLPKLVVDVSRVFEAWAERAFIRMRLPRGMTLTFDAVSSDATLLDFALDPHRKLQTRITSPPMHMGCD